MRTSTLSRVLIWCVCWSKCQFPSTCRAGRQDKERELENKATEISIAYSRLTEQYETMLIDREQLREAFEIKSKMLEDASQDLVTAMKTSGEH